MSIYVKSTKTKKSTQFKSAPKTKQWICLKVAGEGFEPPEPITVSGLWAQHVTVTPSCDI